MIATGQIAIVEVAAALSRKVRLGELSRDEYETTLQLFLDDIAREDYNTVGMTDQW